MLKLWYKVYLCKVLQGTISLEKHGASQLTATGRREALWARYLFSGNIWRRAEPARPPIYLENPGLYIYYTTPPSLRRRAAPRHLLRPLPGGHLVPVVLLHPDALDPEVVGPARDRDPPAPSTRVYTI